MKKLMIFLFVGIVLISIASAEVNNFAPVKQGQSITIKQVCASCSYVNISVSYPNSTLAIIKNEMVDQGGGVWSFEFNETSPLGRYDVTGSGDLIGVDTGFDVLYFEVTSTGKEFNSAKAISYIVILIVSISIFIGILFMAIKLPSKNKSDELTGYIIAVSNLKYLKQTLLGLSYLTLVWISYFVWMITHAFLDFAFLSSFFKVMFYALAISTFPLFILYIYFVITNFVKDSKISDLLLRGLSTK